MFNFEKLEVWQEAIKFADSVYSLTRKFPDEERFGLITQMRRAAVSISSNIAEGSSRSSRMDFARFIEIATGSLFEVISQATISRRRGFLSENAFNDLYSACEKQNVERIEAFPDCPSTLNQKPKTGLTFDSRPIMNMFQIIFTPASAAELARMPKELQLQILGDFRGLPQQVRGTELDDFGKLEQAGRTLHRFRVGDYRVYFERHELGVLVHRILSRHTLKDFLFRSGLKTGEDEALQENPKFWELIESAKTSAKV